MMPSRPATRRRRAAAAVEFAFVVPIFFLFVLGLIEVGRAIMVKHMLTNSARAGCRVGVIEGKSTSDISTAVLASLSGQGINGETATVQVNDNVADASTANAGDEITVIVSVPTSNVSWVPGARYLTGGSLTGKYTLR